MLKHQSKYNTLINRYQSEIEQSTGLLKTIRKRIHLLGTLKLIDFIAGIAIVIVLRHGGYLPVAITVVAAVVLFIVLAVVQDRLFRKKIYLETAIKVSKQEIAALNYDYSGFNDGKEFDHAEHPFAHDIDLFGPNSLFQSLNRTVTASGQKRLANWFMHPLENIDDITERQKAIKELSNLWEWRKDFRVAGLLNKVNRDKDEIDIREWIERPTVFYRYKFLRSLPFVIGGLNVVLLILSFIGIVSFAFWGSMFSIFTGLSFFFTAKISKHQSNYGNKMKILDTYAQLIYRIESLGVESNVLKDLKAKITNEKQQASGIIQQLHKRMNSLDQRNNLIILILLNGLYFKELYAYMQVEKWKVNYGKLLPQWIDAVLEIDALCSLANFAENHPEYISPTPTAKVFTLEGKALGHPLMNREKCVRNDIDISKRPYFIIITGANMAGKSTYLRTVCTNYLLACIGAPVWADEFTFSPARMITSLRTTDSLNDNESYFFAELKRLKFIIDKLNAGETLFIVLDEILKGTNSVDKQKGSLALINQLLSLKANGIIATHDLILGTLKERFPDEIANFCFEADITNNELTFSYRMREGLAQNMNACFLMEKMGIAIAENV